MSARPARFTGRVRLASGAPAYGCRVALVVGDPPLTIAETHTSSKGDFVLIVPPGRAPIGADAAAGFAVHVIDGTGSVLVRRADLVARSGSSTHLQLVADGRALVTLPIALPVLRAHHTPILRPEAMAVIDAALGLLAPVGSDAHTAYRAAARRTVPPPGHVEELLELSWSALDGDPESMADLREVLAVQAAAMRREPVPTGGTTTEARPTRRSRHASYGNRDDGQPQVVVNATTVTGVLLSSRPSGSDGVEPRGSLESAVSTDRLIPLIVATVRVARTPGERVAFFDGLHGILSGLSTMDRLHRAALDVLQERRIAPLRALLALLLAGSPDETDLPLPMAGGVRAPGVDPNLPDLVDPWWERLQICAHETSEALRLRQDADSYAIVDVQPADAPPGATVTLTGTGFGSSPGEVAFPGAAPAEATHWSDTEIHVVVPADAAPGPVSLRLLQDVVRVGKKLVEVYRAGRSASFAGGHPRLRSVLVDGRAEGAWVRPGEPVAVSWTALAGPRGQVALRALLRPLGEPDAAGTVLFDDAELPASGSRIVAVSDVDEEHELVLRLSVDNRVGVDKRELIYPVAVPPVLRIEGVELTQAIQHDPRSGAPPVPTVAGRDTWVRVYVSSEREGFQDDHTTIDDAVLRVAGLTLPPWPVTDEGSVHGAARAVGRASAIDRSRAADAVVFRIPAAVCSGTLELHVEVVARGRPPHAPRAEARVTWTWDAVRPLPVRFARVVTHDLQGKARSADDATARRSIARALDLLPTATADVGPTWLGTFDATGRAVDAGSAVWDRILDQLGAQRDGTAWEWAASALPDLPQPDPDEVWVGVVDERTAPRSDAAHRTALIPTVPADVAATDPVRTAGARALVGVLDLPSSERPERVVDVPWDPFLATTVVDPAHGIRDLGEPPGAGWIGPTRWRRLIGRL